MHDSWYIMYIHYGDVQEKIRIGEMPAHYDDVIWTSCSLKSPAIRLFV